MTCKYWLVPLAVLASTTIALAQSKSNYRLTKVVENVAEKEVELPSHWLGIALRDVDPSLLAHLKLDHGVLIGEVIPDSPAAKAGLQAHDIIVKAGDADIKSGEDLLKAVADAKDSEMTLAIYREGKPQTIKVTPAKRPGDRVAPEPPKAVEGKPREAVERALRLWNDRTGALELDMLGPGVVVRVEPAPLPDDMKITVEREGKKPAKITVTTKEGSWGATGEKEIDTLPEAARPYARQMLGLPVDQKFAWEKGSSARTTKEGMPRSLSLRLPESHNDQLKAIQEELKQLRKEVDELRKGK